MGGYEARGEDESAAEAVFDTGERGHGVVGGSIDDGHGDVCFAWSAYGRMLMRGTGGLCL